MGEVGGHQHGVARGEGAGLAVAHAGVHHVGAFARAPPVTADRNVEGWRGERGGAVRTHRAGRSRMWSECNSEVIPFKREGFTKGSGSGVSLKSAR